MLEKHPQTGCSFFVGESLLKTGRYNEFFCAAIMLVLLIGVSTFFKIAINTLRHVDIMKSRLEFAPKISPNGYEQEGFYLGGVGMSSASDRIYGMSFLSSSMMCFMSHWLK